MKTLEEFLKSVYYTGYLEGEDPVSVFIVAKPERGKTASVNRLITNDGIVTFTDATAWGIGEQIISEIEKGHNIRHIIIPDFLNCIVKQRSTAEKFLMLLNALTEEGVTNIASYANRGIDKKVGDDVKNKRVQCGVIACITQKEYEKRRARWESLGFLSRFLPIQYEYSDSYVKTIFNEMHKGIKTFKEEIKLKAPDEKANISLPENMSKQMQPFAEIIAMQIDAKGIRMMEMFRCLLKANALKNGRNEVLQEDVDSLIEFIKFIKYRGTTNITTIDS